MREALTLKMTAILDDMGMALTAGDMMRLADALEEMIQIAETHTPADEPAAVVEVAALPIIEEMLLKCLVPFATSLRSIARSLAPIPGIKRTKKIARSVRKPAVRQKGRR